MQSEVVRYRVRSGGAGLCEGAETWGEAQVVKWKGRGQMRRG